MRLWRKPSDIHSVKWGTWESAPLWLLSERCWEPHIAALSELYFSQNFTSKFQLPSTSTSSFISCPSTFLDVAKPLLHPLHHLEKVFKCFTSGAEPAWPYIRASGQEGRNTVDQCNGKTQIYWLQTHGQHVLHPFSPEDHDSQNHK